MARTATPKAKAAGAAKSRARDGRSPAEAGEGAAAPAAEPGAPPAALRLKDLVARVAERAEVRKPVARGVLEAALEEIGAALSRGQGLNLPPLGKAKVNRQTGRGGTEVLVVKLRRGPARGDETLAEAGD
ncbi:MAG: HU family DNA-binding protein [Rhodobacteraceae bacterium]|nr:HU family DNA-binding protein [Paracoccaceae bacterium]